MTTKDSKVIIVGAGAFELSTALHLARDAYRDVTVFDRCAYDQRHHDPADGCDGASSNINKIFRATHGDQTHNQNIALEARDIWLQWNEDIRKSTPVDLPAPLTPEDEILKICGVYCSPPSFRNLQYVKENKFELKRLKLQTTQWERKYHLFDRFRDGPTNSFLDTAAGITLADKACVYARHLCVETGVKFVLGDPEGKVSNLVIESTGDQKRRSGIRTCDGKTYSADVVIVAFGPWTAAVVPEASQAVEATIWAQSCLSMSQRTDPSIIQAFVQWDSLAAHTAFLASPVRDPFVEHFMTLLDGSFRLVHVNFRDEGLFAKILAAPVTGVSFVFFEGEAPEGWLESVDEVDEVLKGSGSLKGVVGTVVGTTHEVEVEFEKDDGTKGKGRAGVIVTGYESEEAHTAFRESEEFKKVREVALKGVVKVEPRHVVLKKFEL